MLGFPLGTQELIIIFLIIMVLFGASRLPEIGSGIGKAIKNFKKATSEPDEIDVTPKTAEKKEEEKTDDNKDSA
jgi:sec-independent protein translocase protein TatA